MLAAANLLEVVVVVKIHHDVVVVAAAAQIPCRLVVVPAAVQIPYHLAVVAAAVQIPYRLVVVAAVMQIHYRLVVVAAAVQIRAVHSHDEAHPYGAMPQWRGWKPSSACGEGRDSHTLFTPRWASCDYIVSRAVEVGRMSSNLLHMGQEAASRARKCSRKGRKSYWDSTRCILLVPLYVFLKVLVVQMKIYGNPGRK